MRTSKQTSTTRNNGVKLFSRGSTCDWAAFQNNETHTCRRCCPEKQAPIYQTRYNLLLLSSTWYAINSKEATCTTTTACCGLNKAYVVHVIHLLPQGCLHYAIRTLFIRLEYNSEWQANFQVSIIPKVTSKLSARSSFVIRAGNPAHNEAATSHQHSPLAKAIAASFLWRPPQTFIFNTTLVIVFMTSVDSATSASYGRTC